MMSETSPPEIRRLPTLQGDGVRLRHIAVSDAPALRAIFGDPRVHRLEAGVDPRNDRSLRLLELLGFQREGFLRERHLVAGERQDTVLLGLLFGDWNLRDGTVDQGLRENARRVKRGRE